MITKHLSLSFRVVDVKLRHGSVDVLVQQLGYAYSDVDHDDDGGGGYDERCSDACG